MNMKHFACTTTSFERNDIPSIITSAAKIDDSEYPFSGNIRIHFLRNYTVDNIKPFLKFYLYKAGIKLNLTFGNHTGIKEEILNKSSLIYTESPDVIILSVISDMLGTSLHDKHLLDPADHFDEIKILLDILESSTPSLILINTLIPPLHAEYSAASHFTLEQTYKIIEINQLIREYVSTKKGRFYINDCELFLKILGEKESIDYRLWYLYKAPYKNKFLNLYAKNIARVVCALKGLTKKCLVLDCDDTLWGGVVSEQNIDGIELSNYDYPGKVFFDFQKTVLELQKRGILITLCSKNDESDVWHVMNNHKHCLLQKKHLAAWRINWKNKAENIASLAEELNLPLESMVFIDNSSSECEFIKLALPEVTVLQVPDILSDYPSILFHDGFFDTLIKSDEDGVRHLMYKNESERKKALVDAESYGEFLLSLDLTIEVRPANQTEVHRIAQLTQRTNQFSLNGRRYMPNNIQDLLNDTNYFVFVLYVTDKYGDYGLTGCLIVSHDNDVAFIRSMYLSCRILSKNIEFALVSFCIEHLTDRWGVTTWETEYIETSKNFHVSKFLEEFGFKRKSDANSQYYLNYKNFNVQKPGFIKILGANLND